MCNELSDSKQNQTLHDKANAANLCESSSVSLQPDCSQNPNQDVRGAVGSLYYITVPSGTGLLIYPGIKLILQHINHRSVHLNYLWGCSSTCSTFSSKNSAQGKREEQGYLEQGPASWSHHNSDNMPDARWSPANSHFSHRQVEGTCLCTRCRQAQMESVCPEPLHGAGTDERPCAASPHVEGVVCLAGCWPPHAPCVQHTQPHTEPCLLPWQLHSRTCS